MYMHDIHDVKNFYVEGGLQVPVWVLREAERCDDRFRQLLTEAHTNAQVAKAMNQLASEQAKAALEKVQKAFDLSTAPPSHPTRAEK